MGRKTEGIANSRDRPKRRRKASSTLEPIEELQAHIDNSLTCLLLDNKFAGCRCAGRVKEPAMFRSNNGSRYTEYYLMPGRLHKTNVGIWTAEGHLMIVDYSWYETVKEEDRLLRPPRTPRNAESEITRLPLQNGSEVQRVELGGKSRGSIKHKRKRRSIGRLPSRR